MNDYAAARIELDLHEYFAAVEAIEPPSNFGRMVTALQQMARSRAQAEGWNVIRPSGTHGLAANLASTELSERLVRLLDDEYPVRRALAAIGPRWTEVLEIACTRESIGLEAFGRRAQLAPLASSARRGWSDSSTSRPLGEFLRRLSSRVRHGHGDRVAADRALASEIAREASGLWGEAFGAFCLARARYAALCRGRRWAASAARAARTTEV